MLATFLEVLDTSVANVALPHIAGNLSASTDEATWVLTSYLVSNAIVLPMTGWLGRRVRPEAVADRLHRAVHAGLGGLRGGRRPGTSSSSPASSKGSAAARWQPLSQAILMESFPPEKRGVAMAIFGMGVVVAPIIGPCWAAGSPTTIPGAGCSTSTFPSASWRC